MKKISLVLLALLLICALLTLVSCGGNSDMEEKYLLYIGFSHEDVDMDAMKEQINAICLKHITGYSVYEAEGGWTDSTGRLVEEETLIYAFNFAEKAKVVSIANEVLDSISGSAVLFETQYTGAVHSSSTEFPK